MKCDLYASTGRACEQHPDKPMEHDGCTGPGMPCVCSRSGREKPPDVSRIMKNDYDKEGGSRH
jgi:hypothetical protein